MLPKNQIPEEAFYILNTLNSAGFPSFLVGGCVRDLLLGKAPKDFDICTKAKPEEVKRHFPKVIDTGIKYGTVTVLLDRLKVEVTTFRKVIQYNGGARSGEIEFGQTAEEDVQKRDFTINGLLFDGENVVDYVGGLEDLDRKVIRAIEDPDKRFLEDGLRMIRGIRFVCQFGFAIEPVTLEAIRWNSSFITKVSPERVRDELVKILLSESPSKGFYLLHDTGLLGYILPELERCYQFNQHNPHHSRDVFGHIMSVVENSPPDLKIRLAALLHDIGKPLTFSLDGKGVGHFYGHHLKSYDLSLEVLTRLRFDNKTINNVSALIKEHMNRLKFPKNSTLKRLINRVGRWNIEALLELQMADVKRPGKTDELEDLKRLEKEIQSILHEKEPMSARDLAINGNDLRSLGIEPGIRMGKILSALTDMIIDKPELNTRVRLLEIVQDKYLGTKKGAAQ